MSEQNIANTLIEDNKSKVCLKNNKKCIDAIEQFVSNSSINSLFISTDNLLIQNSLLNCSKNIGKGNLKVYNAKDITNIQDILRSCILINFKSFKEVYEGEITDMKMYKDDIGQVHGIELVLKTSKMSKLIKLSKYMYNLIQNISIGDVVYIEPNLGIIKRIGRSESRLNEYDLEGDKYVQLNRGPVNSIKESDVTITLYDVDYAFNGYNEDITFFTRKHVDEIIKEQLITGIVSYKENILCIHNCHFLPLSSVVHIFKTLDCFPSLKVLFFGDKAKLINHSYFDDIFLISAQNENTLDLLQDEFPKLQNVDFIQAVSSVLNAENYKLITSILKIAQTPEDFITIFNSQNY